MALVRQELLRLVGNEKKQKKSEGIFEIDVKENAILTKTNNKTMFRKRFGSKRIL